MFAQASVEELVFHGVRFQKNCSARPVHKGGVWGQSPARNPYRLKFLPLASRAGFEVDQLTFVSGQPYRRVNATERFDQRAGRRTDGPLVRLAAVVDGVLQRSSFRSLDSLLPGHF